MEYGSNTLKAEEAILQNAELINDVSTEVSKKLSLKDVNITLGKDVIRLALRNSDYNIFKENCSDYGLKSNDFLYSIYKKVNDKKSSLVEQVFFITLFSNRFKAFYKIILQITKILASTILEKLNIIKQLNLKKVDL